MYTPWWQRLSKSTFAERFELGGLAGRRIGFNVAGSVSPKVQKLKDYLSTLDSGTKVQPTKLSRQFNIDRTYISKLIKHEFPNLKSLGRKEAALLTQKDLKTKRMTTSVDVPTPVAEIVKPGSKSRTFVDVSKRYHLLAFELIELISRSMARIPDNVKPGYLIEVKLLLVNH